MLDDSLATFTRRLSAEWLPVYCNDSARQYSPAGYKADSNKVTTADARGFLRALDSGIVGHGKRGGYRLPHGKTEEVIFWEGSKNAVPRGITLWLEPVITISSVARLHLELGWPVTCLALQSVKWEFDLTASLPGNLETEYIAGEVKKTEKELDALIEHMLDLAPQPEVDEKSLARPKLNAYRKLKGLIRRRAPFFWAVGPGGVSHAFAVVHSPESKIFFTHVPLDRLAYPGSVEPARSATDATGG
jgi:hypothetical protein